MYPGPVNSPENHNKGYCSDGAKQLSAKFTDVPEYPQPEGIFSQGKQFDPIVFLKTIREFYEKVVVEKVAQESLTVEDVAFGRMVNTRVIVCNDGAVLFKLYPYLTCPPSTPKALLVMHDEVQCLRVDALRS